MCEQRQLVAYDSELSQQTGWRDWNDDLTGADYTPRSAITGQVRGSTGGDKRRERL
jgi:hypothetical protein